MIRFSMSLIAAAVAAVATPMIAHAAPKAAPEAETATSAKVASVSPAQRYCVVSTPTGTRIERRECKTLAGWLAIGVDPRTGR